jgi:hypothetical protein
MFSGWRRLLFLALAAPAATLAFSNGPVPERTGAAADGGLHCGACHRGNAVNDGRGQLTIMARNFKPGLRQRVRVMLEHPTAMRWGFQITARMASNPSLAAGIFCRHRFNPSSLRRRIGSTLQRTA